MNTRHPPWFKVGQQVIANGKGAGRIIEVIERWQPGYDYYRINFGPTTCHCCGQSTGDRIDTSLAMHTSLTVGEEKALARAGAEPGTDR